MERFDQRATHYFSERQLDKLEILRLRARTAKKGKVKVDKSSLMRFAVEMLLEFAEFNEDLFLAQLKDHVDEEKGIKPSSPEAATGAAQP